MSERGRSCEKTGQLRERLKESETGKRRRSSKWGSAGKEGEGIAAGRRKNEEAGEWGEKEEERDGRC